MKERLRVFLPEGEGIVGAPYAARGIHFPLVRCLGSTTVEKALRCH